MARNEIKIGEIVGRTADGEYVVLDYVFEDKLHGKPYRGAVGSHFMPVTAVQAQEKREEWALEVVDADGDESLFDLSYYDMGCTVAEKYNQEIRELQEDAADEDLAEFSECTGGGRCFNYATDWAKLYRPDLLMLALSFEKPEDGKTWKGGKWVPVPWRKMLRKIFSEAEIDLIVSGVRRRRFLKAQKVDKTAKA